MDILSRISKKYERTDVPELAPGMTVRVHQRILEADNKERVQVFEGMILAVKHGKTVNATYTVRKISDGISVERIFPLHSPMVKKIEIVKKAQVNRAKLNYVKKDKVRRKFTETAVKEA